MGFLIVKALFIRLPAPLSLSPSLPLSLSLSLCLPLPLSLLVLATETTFTKLATVNSGRLPQRPHQSMQEAILIQGEYIDND